MSITKEALEYLVSLKPAELIDIHDEKFANQQLYRIKQATPNALVVRNLTGLIHYLQTNFDKQPPVLVHVAGPKEVVVYSTFNRDYDRNVLIKAEALTPEIRFGTYYDVESFNILLQSAFVTDAERALILKLVGNIVEEDVNTYGDDGIAQTVTAKSGVATRETVIVPNPVKLAPFRTFTEVTQPASDFVFRLKKGPAAALFEADGGAWKNEAISGISKFLADNLAKQIEEEQVTIIA
jgi:hypothetical protein